MNLEAQLKEQLESIQKQLDDVKLKLAQKKTVGGFKPKKGEWYEFIANDVRVGLSEWNNSGLDNDRLAIGNVYRVGEAQAQVDKLKAITEINDWIDEENGDWIADWSDEKNKKTIIHFNHDSKELGLEVYARLEYATVLKYCKSPQVADKIISRITPEQIKAIWGI